VPRSIHAAAWWLLLIAVIGCAAHRDPGADTAPERNVGQTSIAYDSGVQGIAQQPSAPPADRLRIQNEARQAAEVLKQLVAMVLKDPKANPAMVSALTRDVAQLSTGLDAIADSRSDQEFTTAVFDMCEPEPLGAANRVGPLLIGLSARVRSVAPPQTANEKSMAWARYFDSLGETLMRIPRQCRHAQQAVADARNQSRTQTADGIQSQRRHQAAMMLLCMSAGMLAPSPNRYQFGAANRLGYAAQACEP